MPPESASPRQLLLSIRPRFSQAILSGIKTVELRRVRPHVEAGDEVVVYETSPTCAVVAIATVDRLEVASPRALWARIGEASGLTRVDFLEYFRTRDLGFGIVFSSVKELAEPITLRAIRREVPRFHPPQSYHYLRETRRSDRILASCL